MRQDEFVLCVEQCCMGQLVLVCLLYMRHSNIIIIIIIIIYGVRCIIRTIRDMVSFVLNMAS